MTGTQPAVSVDLVTKLAVFMDDHGLCELTFNRIDNTVKMEGRYVHRFKTAPLSYHEGF